MEHAVALATEEEVRQPHAGLVQFGSSPFRESLGAVGSDEPTPLEGLLRCLSASPEDTAGLAVQLAGLIEIQTSALAVGPQQDGDYGPFSPQKAVMQDDVGLTPTPPGPGSPPSPNPRSGLSGAASRPGLLDILDEASSAKEDQHSATRSFLRRLTSPIIATPCSTGGQDEPPSLPAKGRCAALQQARRQGHCRTLHHGQGQDCSPEETWC